ncbi:hypothetical protein P3T76_013571 [Phytophthora citrophthora]|uniref:Uncharacterized protein n=1 Tax=Phytophthora citrophthora TaxID=4793 RepID=A0AAD9LCZ2_9STRA|nr:hypothetical protein P3T76_013571 [Phytophthora citrophthora]
MADVVGGCARQMDEHCSMILEFAAGVSSSVQIRSIHARSSFYKAQFCFSNLASCCMWDTSNSPRDVKARSAVSFVAMEAGESLVLTF